MATINGYEVIQGTGKPFLQGDEEYKPLCKPFKTQRLEVEHPTEVDPRVERTVTRTEHNTTYTYKSTCEAEPNGKSAHEPGAKLDSGKVAAGLVHDFSLALLAIAAIGDFGMKKYTRGGWQEVPNGEERYFDALWRHLLRSRHEELDPDSGLPHLDHALWNLSAVVELRKRGAK